MARKRKLRQKLLGSTKTGRLVRAASLAGVLGGGGFLASRPRGGMPSNSAPSVKSSPSAARTPSPVATIPSSSSTSKPYRPRGSSGAKNPVKHNNRITTVRGLNKRLDRLRLEKNSLAVLGSKDARKGINREVKDKIVAAKTRLKEIPKENMLSRKKIRSKTDRYEPKNWISPVSGRHRSIARGGRN